MTIKFSCLHSEDSKKKLLSTHYIISNSALHYMDFCHWKWLNKSIAYKSVFTGKESYNKSICKATVKGAVWVFRRWVSRSLKVCLSDNENEQIKNVSFMALSKNSIWAFYSPWRTLWTQFVLTTTLLLCYFLSRYLKNCFFVTKGMAGQFTS